jgi:uncharacterized membrane protein YeaQ/YmgE (transglycosylase-associated protein family)
MRRIIFAVVNGCMGALVGLLVAFVTGRNAAIIVCAIIGAIISLLVRPRA